MPNYTPTVLTFQNAIVTVSSTDGTSYETIINSMGSFVYEVNEVYLKSNTQEQILQGFSIRNYDVNGKVQQYIEKPTIDPYQYQNSVLFDIKKKNVVLNGQTSFDANILPNETIFMILYVNQLSVRDYLSGKTAFDNEFFQNFTDAIS